MLIKSADDQSKRIKLLEELQKSPLLDARQIKWLQDELRNLKQGISGEGSAAHYIDRYFKDSENHAILHDLRLVVDGEVAQIDHLIVSRMGYFYLLETKNYSGNVEINEHGEFTAEYGRDKYGIPSPLEQSKRHEPVLTKLLERLEISGRVFKKPQYQHVVLLSPRSIIKRPDSKTFDTSNVIKADQFVQWREKFTEQDVTLLKAISLIANMQSTDVLREWGEKLRRQHRPTNPLELPEFMRPRPPVAQPSSAKPPAKPTLVCASCYAKVTPRVAEFCEKNAKRFGGKVYCFDHQKAF
ncbi:MAG: NERD domain-containing protein [Burkholderiaceae bacterium]